MARAGARKRKAPALNDRTIDATPERIAKDSWEFINPAEIDSSEQPISRTRRVIRVTIVDKLYRQGRLEWREWYAMEMWRRWLEQGRGNPQVTSNYNTSATGGGSGSILPLTWVAENAREFMKNAREAIAPRPMSFIEAAAEPDYKLPAGRNHERAIVELSDALCLLANWLRLPARNVLTRAEK